MKKIFLFIIGFFLIPTILGSTTAYLFNLENYETYVGFWGSIYLLIYIIFPFILKRMPINCCKTASTSSRVSCGANLTL